MGREARVGQLRGVVVAAAVMVLVVPAAARATAITVAPGPDDVTGNTGACMVAGGGESCTTLRDAVAFANAGSAGVNPAIQLSAGAYPLAQSLTLASPDVDRRFG